MRDYGVISPMFWTGKTGRSLRGDPNAQLVALYLMTSPHASMIGVFYCPLVYISTDTGLPLEGASKALARLIEGGFCEVDEASDTIFVVNMAAHQIGETLKPTDNRVESVRRHLRQLGKNPLVARFLAVYSERYGISAESVGLEPLKRTSKAPPKPRSGTGARTGAGDSLGDAPEAPTNLGTSLAPDWKPSPELVAQAKSERPDVDVDLEVRKFVDFWIAKPGKDGRKKDWPATFRNWIRNAKASRNGGLFGGDDWRKVAI